MTINLSQTIRDAKNIADNITPIADLDSWKRAVKVISRNIDKEKVGIVQGPPGTGKTTIYANAFSKYFDKVGNGNIIVYVAPTNELVYDMFRKVIMEYVRKGNTERIPNEVRVYGSRFSQESDIRSIRNPPDIDTKIVLMTNYQRLYQGDNELNYNIMIDEASKSPIHIPFIGLADQLVKGDLQGSLSIVGDPMQAISLGSYGGYAKRMLMMTYLLAPMLNHSSRDLDAKALLAEAKESQIRGKSFEFLETSLRIPGPSEQAISMGFYDGDLKAYTSASQRLAEYYDDNIGRYFMSQESESLKMIAKKIEELISTDRCMLYARVQGKSSYSDYSRKYGLTYDQMRSQVGIETAIVLSAVTRKHTTVITTYVDQQTQMDLLMRQNYAHLLTKFGLSEQIKFATAQSLLGAEDDNIVAVLGKEHSSPMSNPNDSSTVYFQEPELLNVQLSRHKRFVAIIGNLSVLVSQASKQAQTLKSSKFSPLSVTADHLLQQSGFDKRTSKYVKTRNSDVSGFIDFGGE